MKLKFRVPKVYFGPKLGVHKEMNGNRVKKGNISSEELSSDLGINSHAVDRNIATDQEAKEFHERRAEEIISRFLEAAKAELESTKRLTPKRKKPLPGSYKDSCDFD